MSEAIVGWTAGLVMVAIIVGAPVSCSMRANELKAEAIAKGSDPMAADCAFSSMPNTIVCAVSAAAGKEATK